MFETLQKRGLLDKFDYKSTFEEKRSPSLFIPENDPVLEDHSYTKVSISE